MTKTRIRRLVCWISPIHRFWHVGPLAEGRQHAFHNALPSPPVFTAAEPCKIKSTRTSGADDLLQPDNILVVECLEQLDFSYGSDGESFFFIVHPDLS